MNKDTLRAMLKSLPDVKEDGATFHIDLSWDVSAYAGRVGAPLTVQQVKSVRLEEHFVTVETKKGQLHTLLLEEMRGFSADPGSQDHKTGRKTGFM